ncbi:hypothetical protein SDC9_84662 [bioreactor metagenome]|uniref:Uncharacterized protein n=1 Tax=bioreactor metagenome TaxID=1076179 RepID=A0A644ZBE5_9ZZZZ
MQLGAVNQLFIIDQRFERCEAIGNIGALNRLNAGEVVVRAACGHVDTGLHAVVNHAGEKWRR